MQPTGGFDVCFESFVSPNVEVGPSKDSQQGQDQDKTCQFYLFKCSLTGKLKKFTVKCVLGGGHTPKKVENH